MYGSWKILGKQKNCKKIIFSCLVLLWKIWKKVKYNSILKRKNGIKIFKIMKIFKLCLIPEKYQGKKKNDKKNNFVMFGFTMENANES